MSALTMAQLTEDQVRHVRMLARSGFNATEIAAQTGHSKATICSVSEMVSKHSMIRTHRDVVQTMAPIEAVEYLLSVIEMAEANPKRDDIVNWVHLGMSGTEASYAALFHMREGKCVLRSARYDLSCIGKPEARWPDDKIVDVYVSKVRRKLPEGFSIVTVWGQGYSMRRAAGAKLPWEVA